MAERRLQGTGAAPGAALGRVVRYTPARQAPEQRRVSPGEIDTEIARLRAAVEQARKRISAARAATAERAGETEAAIFDAHLLMLDDPALIGESERRIRDEHLPAAAAIEATAAELRRMFDEIEDSYLRERGADLADVAAQVVRALEGDGDALPPGGGDADRLPEDAVLVAEELLPSDTALLNPERVAALVTARGGRTAHASILARALGLPAVVGVVDILAEARDGELAAVDGERGEVVLAPDPATRAGFEARVAAAHHERQRLAALRELPAVTQDGVRVALFANIGAPGELASALAQGAEGIGLFRTEFLFIERAALPDEEEQAAAYAEVARGMAGRPVVIRTLDVGGDKPVPGIEVMPEMNPFLGVRGLRLSLRHPAIFRTQLRAILRAATDGDVWLMFPMVTTVADVRAARTVLDSVAAELRAEGVAHRADIPVGIMIEVPAAALMADRLIQEVDFFSLGTNDLVQYALAVDRTNEALADSYAPLDPAVLRLIERAVAAAEAAGKPVAVCGELAGDPAAISLLVGLGLRELSMTAASIPRAKELIRGLDAAAAAKAARDALVRE